MPLTRRNAAPNAVNGISCKIVTGTSGATEGSTTTVAHGLLLADIVSWVSNLKLSATSIITQGHTATNGFKYQVFPDTNNMVIQLDGISSENALSKAVEILIWFRL